MSRQRIILMVLATAAVFQTGFLVHRATRDVSPQAPMPVLDSLGRPIRHLVEGDIVTDFAGEDASGRSIRVSLADGTGWTVLLAVKSTCVYCDQVAPTWRAWLAGPPTVRVIAITSDSVGVARDYLREHGIETKVLSVAGLPRNTRERMMTSRTPWLFLLDSAGRVHLTRHGGEIASIDSALASATQHGK